MGELCWWDFFTDLHHWDNGECITFFLMLLQLNTRLSMHAESLEHSTENNSPVEISEEQEWETYKVFNKTS